MNTRTFRQFQRAHAHGFFGAVEYAFDEFKKIENVQPTIMYDDSHQYEFLINDHTRSALFKKCVMRIGR